MRFVDLIEKKKKGLEHTKEEIQYIINSVMNGNAEDYQIAAWLMAVYFKGMTLEETAEFTKAIIASGETIDLSALRTPDCPHIADKHSTGGVGDKITLILIPILAACGVPVAKLSGKGLGHTGGTIDKLESIPGFNTDLSVEELIEKVKNTGLAICAQTKQLTPADGKLYALRDVTATVDSVPLIASSVVSKKIASGADYVVLDVKYGSGAFLKTPDEACELAQWMVNIAEKLGKKFHALITSMEQPLGRAVGNAIEVIESIEFLKGNMTSDIKQLTFEMAALTLGELGICNSKEEAYIKIEESINSSKALEYFKKLIESQCGNTLVTENYRFFPQPNYAFQLKSETSGYISNIDAYKTAYACKLLGAGREKKTDNIDYSAGIYLNKIYGEYVSTGDVIATLYANDPDKIEKAMDYLETAYTYSYDMPQSRNMIYRII